MKKKVIKLKNLLLENTTFGHQLEKEFNQKYPPPKTGTKAEMGGIVVELYKSKLLSDFMELSAIFIPKQYRGQGIGDQIMTRIIIYADKHKITIGLTPSTDFGGSQVSLV